VRIYLAAPLFSQVERLWNRKLGRELEQAVPDSQVVLPQDFRVGDKYNDRSAFKKLFERCNSEIRASDVVVAILDGADVDSGVGFEIGLAYALGIPVIGLRTDYRQQQEKGINFMVYQACATYILELAFAEDMSRITRKLARKIVGLAKNS